MHRSRKNTAVCFFVKFAGSSRLQGSHMKRKPPQTRGGSAVGGGGRASHRSLQSRCLSLSPLPFARIAAIAEILTDARSLFRGPASDSPNSCLSLTCSLSLRAPIAEMHCDARFDLLSRVLCQQVTSHLLLRSL